MKCEYNEHQYFVRLSYENIYNDLGVYAVYLRCILALLLTNCDMQVILFYYLFVCIFVWCRCVDFVFFEKCLNI